MRTSNGGQALSGLSAVGRKLQEQGRTQAAGGTATALGRMRVKGEKTHQEEHQSSNSENAKKKTQYFEYFKAICMLAVINTHCKSGEKNRSKKVLNFGILLAVFSCDSKNI